MSTLEQIQAGVKATIQQLPLVLGNAAVNWVKDSFTQQGWRGATFEGWKAVKNEKRKAAAILIKTGRLRRSIRIVKMNASSVSIGSDVPYAEVHNDGFNGSVSVSAHSRNKYGKAKATSLKTKRQQSITFIDKTSQIGTHSRNMNMPRRQFAPHDIGDSPVFMLDMEAVVKNQLSNYFN